MAERDKVVDEVEVALSKVLNAQQMNRVRGELAKVRRGEAHVPAAEAASRLGDPEE